MYPTHGKAYLRRARARLADGSQESLFYAAFELRTGIESRMHEYLEAREDIAKRKKHGYQIAKLAKGLESVFAADEKVVEVKVAGRKKEELLAVYFTPVRASLRKHAERLGDLLHNQPFREDTNAWWVEQRQYLETVATELAFATSGTLMGPPLIERRTRNMSFVIATDPSEDSGSHLTQIGARVTLYVNYLDDLPSPGRAHDRSVRDTIA